MKKFDLKANVQLVSDTFGLCSHGQYFPDHVSKVLLQRIDEVRRENVFLLAQNQIFLSCFKKSFEKAVEQLTKLVCRYFSRLTGVFVLQHTEQFFYEQFSSMSHENYSKIGNSVFETILAKILSQIEFFVNHPFLSMMYQDGWAFFSASLVFLSNWLVLRVTKPWKIDRKNINHRAWQTKDWFYDSLQIRTACWYFL